jgi:hypothetical protein
LVVSTSSQALENSALTGFQIDNRGQYFTYGGLRTALSRPDWPVKPFVQVFALQQRFYVRSESQLLPGQLTQVAPTVGLSKSIGNLEVQLSGGPSFLISHSQNLVEDQQENLIRQKEMTTKVGYAFSGYAQYWKDSHGLEGLVSYTNLSEVFYGRLRWFYAAY